MSMQSGIRPAGQQLVSRPYCCVAVLLVHELHAGLKPRTCAQTHCAGLLCVQAAYARENHFSYRDMNGTQDDADPEHEQVRVWGRQALKSQSCCMCSYLSCGSDCS